MFKQHDIINWCGGLGEVTKVFRGTIYVDFYYQVEGRTMRDAIWFTDDFGRYKPYHSESTIRLATAAEITRWQAIPKTELPAHRSP